MRRLLLLLIATATGAATAQAGAGRSGGLSLLDAPSARVAALGGAGGALADDVSVFALNPSALGTLTDGQASFLFQRGIADDKSGRVLVGRPAGAGGWGVSLSYLDGGSLDLIDASGKRSVDAEKDMAAAVGYGRSWGLLQLGFSASYLSTQLIETDKASAVALDAGARMDWGDHLSGALAVQNVGSSLKYNTNSDPLPRLVRASVAFRPAPVRLPLALVFDAPYSTVDHDIQWSAGAEGVVGPLALRAGYQAGRDAERLSLGMGFTVGRLSLDYAFGMVQNFDDRHRLSLTLRFGDHAGDSK